MLMRTVRAWRRRQRYRAVISVCLPLVMGMSATTVMEFTDRVFLANYSVTAISAATPGGIAAFLFMVFFGGITGYCSVFIAQYHGAGQPERIGPILWQGIYCWLIAAAVLVGLAHFLSRPLFELAGHAPEVRALERVYFSILCYSGIFYVATQTLSAFFSGRGLTRPVMFANVVAMALNIPLDYGLIYGAGPLPELGIAGAGLATVISAAASSLFLGLLVFRRSHEAEFGVISRRRFEPGLLARLLRFAIPGTMQFTLDILAFSIFIMIVGRIGTTALAASNIVIAINSLAFMPALGVSQGVSVLTGQALGKRTPEPAEAATWSAIHLLVLYTLVVDLVIIFFPAPVIALFVPREATAAYGAVAATATGLLRIVACYLVFDALYCVFAGVLRGAGDTRYLMCSLGGAALFCFMMPLVIGIEYAGYGVYYSWMCVLFFILALCLLTGVRYRRGPWRTMLVIGGGGGRGAGRR